MRKRVENIYDIMNNLYNLSCEYERNLDYDAKELDFENINRITMLIKEFM